MDSEGVTLPSYPTAWNINDKSDSLSVDLNGLRVNYTGEVIVLKILMKLYLIVFKYKVWVKVMKILLQFEQIIQFHHNV